MVAPVAGEVVVTVDSGHAIGLKTDDGVEVLVHVGIDTVNMEGKGFTQHVSKGQRVQAGDLLLEADLPAIEEAGHSTTTAVLVTNSANHKAVTSPATGNTVDAGDTVIVVSK
ncbi:PTS sugar transporter subunit IIA [Actinomyces ruminis]|uniref:PTS sugar transporter subunit IIA n=1 Tax=Actinomyces ruminis TaxID=1937003 RepID=UPI00211E129C|nr:PTS glucose transporter subunit IIA [Actinomyces ruminis]